MALLPRRRDSFQHLRKTGLAISIYWRKISSADERFQIGREPDTHRPTTAAGCRLDEGHVNAIDIGPFFTIDFDVHKLAIHDRGRLFVLERLVCHHVAPVTGRITDREKDRFVLATGFGECFFAPRIPIDRIMRVLKKIRRLLARESVRVRRVSRLNFRGHGSWCH